MTLMDVILKKVKSQEQFSTTSYLTKQPGSPPPEIENVMSAEPKKKKKYVFKYAYVKAAVDTSPPALDVRATTLKLPQWSARAQHILHENRELVKRIKRAHFTRGKVDCRWEVEPPRTQRYYYDRVNFWRRVYRENQLMYSRINSARRVPKVWDCAWLEKEWRRMHREMALHARTPFTLFDLEPKELVEDEAFLAAEGVKRPRIRVWLRTRQGAGLGHLELELFTEHCPTTCALFTELMMGGAPHCYIGTRFFRKVPQMFWTGGDVVYDCGFGCYMQRGLTRPVGAENYHFSHSMPGLLTMRVTADDEVCGIFSITFKPLPQLDLRNVVFGRVIRPSSTYNAIVSLGSPLAPQPIIEINAATLKVGNKWIRGKPNNKMVDINDTKWRRERGDLQHHRAQNLGLI